MEDDEWLYVLDQEMAPHWAAALEAFFSGEEEEEEDGY